MVTFGNYYTSTFAAEYLSGIAYDWKNHMLLQDVAVSVKGGGAPAEGANAPIQFKALSWDASGHASAGSLVDLCRGVFYPGLDWCRRGWVDVCADACAEPSSAIGATQSARSDRVCASLSLCSQGWQSSGRLDHRFASP